MKPLRLLALAILAALATALLGWWATCLVGLGRGIGAGAARRRALEAGLAAALGWAMLLAWIAASAGAPVWRLAGEVGGLFGLPAIGLVAATLLFAGLLAGSAAATASALIRRQRP